MASQTELAADAILGAGSLPQESAFFGPLSLPSGLDSRDYLRMYKKANAFDEGLSKTISTVAENRAIAEQKNKERQASFMESDALAELSRINVSGPGAREALGNFSHIAGLSRSVGAALTRKYKDLDDQNKRLSDLTTYMAKAGYNDLQAVGQYAAAELALHNNSLATYNILSMRAQRDAVEATARRSGAYNQKDYGRAAEASYLKTGATARGLFGIIPPSVRDAHPGFFNQYEGLRTLTPEILDKGVEQVLVTSENMGDFRLTDGQIKEIGVVGFINLRNPKSIKDKSAAVSKDIVGTTLFGPRRWSDIQRAAAKGDKGEFVPAPSWENEIYGIEGAEKLWQKEIKPTKLAKVSQKSGFKSKEAVAFVEDMRKKASEDPTGNWIHHFSPGAGDFVIDTDGDGEYSEAELADFNLKMQAKTASGGTGGAGGAQTDLRKFLAGIHDQLATIPKIQTLWNQWLITSQLAPGYVQGKFLEVMPQDTSEPTVDPEAWAHKARGE